MDDYQNPDPSKTYFSPSLPAFGQQNRKIRIASKVIESSGTYAFATVKDEVVLRQKEGAKTNIKAKFFEDDRGISVLSIQGYTVASDKPHNATFSFVGEEITTLLEFIANIRTMAFPSSGTVNITDKELRLYICFCAFLLPQDYFSPSLPAFGQQNRKIRIASKVIESSGTYAFATVKDEVVLRQKEGAKTNIKAKFFEDDRGISVLSIQGYTVASDKPHNATFSFVGEEITTLLEFIANIRTMAFPSSGTVNITDKELRRLVLSKLQAQNLVENNEEFFAEIVSSSITKRDVVAVAYRKKQLESFRSLLEDPAYFDRAKEQNQCNDEALWQKFFEKNPWIFGYGLNYIYLDTLDDKKLEQVVQGHHVGAHGKRVDGLMKSKGVISSLCFIEIKTHKTPLLSNRSYRAGCWPPSTELTGAVSQVQGTVASAMDTIRGKLEINDSDGYPTGEEAYNYSPKAYLVVGNLGTFTSDQGVNQEQFRSFELFRRNTHNPEIIAFDELYERAKFIVYQNE